jgi:hypothetical protein
MKHATTSIVAVEAIFQKSRKRQEKALKTKVIPLDKGHNTFPL